MRHTSGQINNNQSYNKYKSYLHMRYFQIEINNIFLNDNLLEEEDMVQTPRFVH